MGMIIRNFLMHKGLIKGRAIKLEKMLKTDWEQCSLSLSNRIWAMRRGFLPNRVELYGLTEDNYKDYLSDIDYFRLHPLNNHFAIWINDKLTLKYVIPHDLPIGDNGKTINVMPDYYLYVENDGRYSYLMDSPKTILHDENYLLNLLKEKGELAMKPSRGAGGFGFVKAEYKDGVIIWAKEQITEEEFLRRKDKLNGYLIMEYCHQHPDLDKVWQESECTLRIIVCKQWKKKYENGEIKAFVNYARFGTSVSGGASNLSSGGVGAPFDLQTGVFTGEFHQYKQFSIDGRTVYLEHPDSHYDLKGKQLPNWKLVRDVVSAICEHLSSLEYFGFDFIVTKDGVKMCEINTHPSLDYEQVMFGPIWKNENAKDYFELKMKNNKK